MSKVITSAVKRFPGTVTLVYPFTYPVYTAWKNAVKQFEPGTRIGTVSLDDDMVQIAIQGICACIEKWDIEEIKGEAPRGTVTPETFPASPRISSARLISWLMSEINKVIAEEDETDPLA